MKIKHAIQCALLTVLTSVAGASDKNLITNGSFEDYEGTGFNSNLGAGLAGWTIGNEGGIDIILSTGVEPYYWQAAQGAVSISLNRDGPDSISQSVKTRAGTRYLLSFWMAAEIYGGPAGRTMEVVWNGEVLGTPSFEYTGQGPANMGWVEFGYEVTGSGSDTLTFRSTTSGDRGPALDNVALVEAPELKIRASEAGFVLTWPVSATNYVLKTTLEIPSAPWVQVTNTPVQFGDNFRVILEPASESGFFKLERPFGP